MCVRERGGERIQWSMRPPPFGAAPDPKRKRVRVCVCVCVLVKEKE